MATAKQKNPDKKSGGGAVCASGVSLLAVPAAAARRTDGHADSTGCLGARKCQLRSSSVTTHWADKDNVNSIQKTKRAAFAHIAHGEPASL